MRRALHGSTVALEVAGDFDLAGVHAFERACGEICRGGVRRLVIDLERVDFLDLAAVRAILRANDLGKKHAVEVAIVRPRGLADRIFGLIGIHKEVALADVPSNGSD